MTAALQQTWQINLRYIRAFVRQPAWVAIALVQPIIWLLLFGQLFKSVVEIPGFQGGSYIEFLMPGVAVISPVNARGHRTAARRSPPYSPRSTRTACRSPRSWWRGRRSTTSISATRGGRSARPT